MTYKGSIDVLAKELAEAKAEADALRSERDALETALDELKAAAYFIVLNKQNFIIGDVDGVAASAIDHLSALVRS